ncbi:hypothetical protein R3P38DRAFT_2991054 [Favolaschia claudopus]|uniref:Uncharacterized protein n=1 Tax=Favolaschia claudopus TaxID=2862362 RepID=A0AAW0AV33_9AGAR
MAGSRPTSNRRAKKKDYRGRCKKAQREAMTPKRLPFVTPPTQHRPRGRELQPLENQVEALNRKNKRLSKALRRSKLPTDTDTEDITAIRKPSGKFNIKSAMGLDDNHNLFVELQASIRAIAIEVKIDFNLPWKEQDPGDLAKVLRIAAGRNSYLSAKRFPRHWATQAILHRYINSVRGYTAGKANPRSGVNRRRERKHDGVEAVRETPPPRQNIENAMDSGPSHPTGEKNGDSGNEDKGNEDSDDEDDEDEDDEDENEYEDEEMLADEGEDDEGSDGELPMAQD